MKTLKQTVKFTKYWEHSSNTKRNKYGNILEDVNWDWPKNPKETLYIRLLRDSKTWYLYQGS